MEEPKTTASQPIAETQNNVNPPISPPAYVGPVLNDQSNENKEENLLEKIRKTRRRAKVSLIIIFLSFIIVGCLILTSHSDPMNAFFLLAILFIPIAITVLVSCVVYVFAMKSIFVSKNKAKKSNISLDGKSDTGIIIFGIIFLSIVIGYTGIAVNNYMQLNPSGPTKTAVIVGNYKWKEKLDTEGYIQDLLFSFDVKANKDVKIEAFVDVNSAKSIGRETKDLKQGQVSTMTITIDMSTLILNSSKSLQENGKFTITKLTLLDSSKLLALSDEKSNVISGTLDTKKIDYSTLSLGVMSKTLPVPSNPVGISGSAYSKNHTISSVELSFDEGKDWYPALSDDNTWGNNSVKWKVYFTLKDGDYGVIARMLDMDKKVIPLTNPMDATPSIWFEVKTK